LPEPVRIDIREFGGGIDPDQEDSAILSNAKVAYFPGVGPGGGYEYPKYGSTICYVPYTLLTTYGGELYEDIIRQRIIKHMVGGEYPIIRLTGVIPEWTFTDSINGIESIIPKQAILNWYIEDPSYTFNIYKSVFKDSGFTLYSNVTGTLIPHTPNNTLVVTGLTSGITYYFYITALSTDGIESPKSKTLGVKIV